MKTTVKSNTTLKITKTIQTILLILINIKCNQQSPVTVSEQWFWSLIEIGSLTLPFDHSHQTLSPSSIRRICGLNALSKISILYSLQKKRKNDPGLDNKIPNFINQNTHESYHSVTSHLQYPIPATLDDKLRGLLAWFCFYRLHLFQHLDNALMQ